MKIEMKTDFQKIQNKIGLLKKSSDVQLSRVAKRQAELFRHFLLEAITTQRYENGWSYSPDYADWKKRRGYTGGFWKATGDLIASITVKRIRGGHKVYIPAVYYGGKGWGQGDHPRKVAKYAKSVEAKFPTWGPAEEEFNRDIWPKELEKIARKMHQTWT